MWPRSVRMALMHCELCMARQCLRMWHWIGPCLGCHTIHCVLIFPYRVPYYIIQQFNAFGEPISYDTLFRFIVSYHIIHCSMPTCIQRRVEGPFLHSMYGWLTRQVELVLAHSCCVFSDNYVHEKVLILPRRFHFSWLQIRWRWVRTYLASISSGIFEFEFELSLLMTWVWYTSSGLGQRLSEHANKACTTITSLLFVKACFYTHILEPSKKMFAWEDRYIIHCSGASAMLTIVSSFLSWPLCVS